jgi:hypothetical protein
LVSPAAKAVEKTTTLTYNRSGDDWVFVDLDYSIKLCEWGFDIERARYKSAVVVTERRQFVVD